MGGFVTDLVEVTGFGATQSGGRGIMLCQIWEKNKISMLILFKLGVQLLRTVFNDKMWTWGREDWRTSLPPSWATAPSGDHGAICRGRFPKIEIGCERLRVVIVLIKFIWTHQNTSKSTHIRSLPLHFKKHQKDHIFGWDGKHRFPLRTISTNMHVIPPGSRASDACHGANGFDAQGGTERCQGAKNEQFVDHELRVVTKSQDILIFYRFKKQSEGIDLFFCWRDDFQVLLEKW